MGIVYLIGFMGSGKSTVGRILSDLMNKTYVDTDDLIVETVQKNINQIFKEEGEVAFRNYEQKLLRTIHDGVVSTGGGIVERLDNIAWMKKHGKIVYLETSFEEISLRLKGDQSRPLWNKEKKLLYDKRCTLYTEAADIAVETDERSQQQIANQIYQAISS